MGIESMSNLGPSNEEIANLFEELAIYLELEGENPFKTRAYRNASHLIKGMGVPLYEMVIEGKDLKEFNGIGKNIEKKIKQIIQTGSLKKLQELRQKYPEGLLDILKVPGIGPKKVLELYNTYNLSNIHDLYIFAKNGHLKQVPGFGEKKEKKIISFLEKTIHQRKTFKLIEVDSIVKQFTQYLKQEINPGDFLIVGSYRRKKEKVGDINILLKNHCLHHVMSLLKKYSYEKNGRLIIQKNSWQIELKNKLKINITPIESSKFGIESIFYTGSKKFNNELLIYSKTHLSIPNLWEDNIFTNLSEKEIFQKLNLQFIPPELREARGEIQAAHKKSLPILVEISDILGDLHIHTNYTDGKNKIEEYANIAISKGYEYICITDHSKRLKMVGGLDKEDLKEQAKEIDKVNNRFPQIKIFKGIEVDILEDGSLDLPDSVLKELDIVIASVHSRFELPKDKQTSRIIKAMTNQYVNIIGHPTGRLIDRRNPYEIDIHKILEYAQKTGCILELNSQPERLDLNDLYLKYAKEVGVKICINSDAHDIHGLDLIRYGIYQARRGWLEPKDIINTLPRQKLIDILKKKQ